MALLAKEPVYQGGGLNFLGIQPIAIDAPMNWKSSPDHPEAHLAYITNAEQDLLINANLHGGLEDGKPNKGPSGIPSLQGDLGGWSGDQGETSSDSGFNNNDRDTGSDYGQFDRAVAQAANNPPSHIGSGDGGNNNLIDPGFHPALAAQQAVEYQEMLGQMDEGLGVGSITSTTYDPETGQFTYEQTPGLIDTETYQTENLGAYLDSPDVSDAEKIATLNQLQAISNSNLKGTKLSNVKGDDTEQFIIDNLDASLENIKNLTEYSKYTSSIDENAQTFAGEMEDSGIMGVVKSGGVIGSMIKGVTDQYKNNKALELLGYTGKVMRDPSGDPSDFMTGGGSDEYRGAINQIAPQASYAVANQTPIPSMVDQWFANNQAGTGLDPNYLNTYNTAKAQIANTMGMVDTSNQFGYSATPYGGLTAQNLNTNPFNTLYMRQLGLI